ncbi:MAG: hypothetical protein AAF702_49325 [Chloroflexota bacterium]
MTYMSGIFKILNDSPFWQNLGLSGSELRRRLLELPPLLIDKRRRTRIY